MSEMRQKLYDLVQSIHESEIERVLKAVTAVTETTDYERMKQWEEKIASQPVEELTDEEGKRLDEALNDENAEYVPLEELLENMGYNADGTKR